MGKGELARVGAVLAALYLRGGPTRGPLRRARWGLVRDVLCREWPPLPRVAEVLREAGLWDEAAVAELPGIVAWGLSQVERHTALTAVDPTYPTRWLHMLGASAPPCLWATGPVPAGPFCTVVGSRRLHYSDRLFARELGAAVVSLGHNLATGGAAGADAAATCGALEAAGQGRVVHIVPTGLDRAAGPVGPTRLSASAPDADFTTGQAMERNTLLYAASAVTVVVRPRFRVGGSWHGAVAALRQRTSRVAVVGPPTDEAVSALRALGADVLEDPGRLSELIRAAEQDHSGLRLPLDQTG